MVYKDLKLKTKEEYNSIQLQNGIEIKVLKYLPIEDKIDLIQIALQKSEENGVYNEMKLDMYFNLYLIYMYTDLQFSEDEKLDEFGLYNELESNDIIVQVIGGMEEMEYENLLNYLHTMQYNNMKYRRSAAALIQSFIQDLPKNAEAAAQIVDNFDKEKYQNVVEFAKSVNANRPV